VKYRRASIIDDPQREKLIDQSNESLEEAIIIHKHNRKRTIEERKRWLNIKKEDAKPSFNIS
jgi:hypothetical protein